MTTRRPLPTAYGLRPARPGPYAGLPGLKPTAKTRGLSLAQVAARVGVHPTHLSLVVTGRRRISDYLATRLCAPDVLACRWADLQPFYAQPAAAAAAPSSRKEEAPPERRGPVSRS